MNPISRICFLRAHKMYQLGVRQGWDRYTSWNVEVEGRLLRIYIDQQGAYFVRTEDTQAFAELTSSSRKQAPLVTARPATNREPLALLVGQNGAVYVLGVMGLHDSTGIVTVKFKIADGRTVTLTAIAGKVSSVNL